MKHTSDDLAIDHLAYAILHQGDHIVMVQQQSPHDEKTYWVLPGLFVFEVKSRSAALSV